MDVVLRDNLLEWYNRQWYDSDGPKEEPKADGAPVLSATLPPYGPLTIAEVAAAMEKAGSKRYVYSFIHSFIHSFINSFIRAFGWAVQRVCSQSFESFGMAVV
jgi:hypothetical protein